VNAKDSSPDSVGQRLRWAREQAGLSQGQVAKQFDLHRPTISQIEAGKRNVRPDEVAKFADLYDVREDWIISGVTSSDVTSDPRFKIAARELSKLKPEDLDVILSLLSALKSRDGDNCG
jgi:transcriptional regulator with XRE-family HTH domain